MHMLSTAKRLRSPHLRYVWISFLAMVLTGFRPERSELLHTFACPMYVHSEVVVTQLEHRFPTAPSPETLPLQLLPSLGDTYNSQRTKRESSAPQQHIIRRARRTFFLAALVACPATFLLVRQVVSARSLILGRHCGVSWAYGTRTMEDRWWWWLLQGR